MTELNKAEETARTLTERAESTDPDWALSNESPLALEISGKYVNVLFSTGGPHTEITVEYDDAEAAEYWFENDPQGAWVTYKDWGTREDVYIPRYQAAGIMAALMRDTDDLGGQDGIGAEDEWDGSLLLDPDADTNPEAANQ